MNGTTVQFNQNLKLLALRPVIEDDIQISNKPVCLNIHEGQEFLVEITNKHDDQVDMKFEDGDFLPSVNVAWFNVA